MTNRKNHKDWINVRGRVEHWRIIGAFLVIYDIIAVNAAFFMALWLRFDFMFNEIKPVYLKAFYRFAPN